MGIMWASREVFTGNRKSGRGNTPEKPLIEGVATVAGAVTPSPVLQDPLADGRFGAEQIRAVTPPVRPAKFDWLFVLFAIATVLVASADGVIVFNLLKLIAKH